MIIPPNSPRWNSESRPLDGLSQREIETPEGLGYDLRVSEIFELIGRGYLGVTHRNTPNTRSLGCFTTDGEKHIALEAGKYYLAQTVETVSFSPQMGGLIFPRSTLFRSGVILQSSIVPSGYVGPLTFGLAVWAGEGFEIELGARFAHLVVVAVGEGATAYEGQWNGGRVSVGKPEVQK
jgi:deoxycytidine triphosphate deaminase